MVAPKFFEKIAPVYEFLTRMFMLGTFESMRKRMLDEDTSEFTVLDLCTGTGYIANTVNAKKIVGLDMSDAMLAVNEKVKRENKTLIKVNAYQMDFPDNTFDRVYNSSASHEFKLFDRLIKKANKALKPGGKFILFDIYQPKNKFYSLIVNTIYRYIVEHDIMWVHTIEEWQKMFEEAGYRVEEIEPVRGVFIYIKAAKL